MSYATISIGALLPDVNNRFFLPAIQRPYVWSSDQVIALIDSLMKGYPISAFLFWKINDELKQELSIYRFIEAWRQDRQNETTTGDGRDVTFVLDGQQRLTSLLIALRGTFGEKAKFKRKSTSTAWTDRTLYIDLLKDPAFEDDEVEDELGVSYGLKFHDVAPRSDPRHLWFRLGEMLNYETLEARDALIDRMVGGLRTGANTYERDLITSTLTRLHAVVWLDQVINYYTETSGSVDRVLDIFVRANDGGTPLTKSDLLISLMTSKWENGSARDAVFGLVDHINKELTAPNAITKDFVMKTCLVLLGFDVTYNLKNFTPQSIAKIEESWPQIADALERTFRFLNAIGINRESKVSLNATLPIVLFLYRNPGITLRGSSEFDRVNAQAIHRWFLNTVLMGVFSGTSDRTIAAARSTMDEAGKTSRTFPEEALYHNLAIGGRLTRLDERAVEDLLALEYGKAKTFLALSLLYDDLDWAGTHYHVDHVIPQARADRRILMAKNLPEHRIQEIGGAVNRLANLQLLPGGENIEKSDLPFEAWITGRSDDYLSEHLIPDAPDLWTEMRLPEFVQHRERLIREKLLALTVRAGR